MFVGNKRTVVIGSNSFYFDLPCKETLGRLTHLFGLKYLIVWYTALILSLWTPESIN
jgi:hypothetical protein